MLLSFVVCYVRLGVQTLGGTSRTRTCGLRPHHTSDDTFSPALTLDYVMVRYRTFGRASLYFEWKWRWTRLKTLFGLMPAYQQPEWKTWANMCSRDFCNFVDHSWLHYLSNKTCLWWNSALWIFFELFCVYVCVCVCIAANLYHLKSHLAFQTLYFAFGQLH